MDWVEEFLDKLGEVIELQSPGTISWRFIEIENWLLLAPCPLELAGGADDGESVYPFYSLQFSELIEIFDEPPEIHWETMRNELSVEGGIEGDDAWITFSSEPFADDEPEEVLDPDGGIRKEAANGMTNHIAELHRFLGVHIYEPGDAVFLLLDNWRMGRKIMGEPDIVLIIEGVKKDLPDVEVRQHWVRNPNVDDDGVWWFFLPGVENNIQIESSHGTCPFLVEHDEMRNSSERETAQSISEAVEKIVSYLTSLKARNQSEVSSDLMRRKLTTPSDL